MYVVPDALRCTTRKADASKQDMHFVYTDELLINES